MCGYETAVALVDIYFTLPCLENTKKSKHFVWRERPMPLGVSKLVQQSNFYCSTQKPPCVNIIYSSAGMFTTIGTFVSITFNYSNI